MPSLIQDLEILSAVAGDLPAFAAGQPVPAKTTIAGYEVDATVQFLPNGANGTDFQVFSGTPWGMLFLALEDATALSAGQQLKVAEKVGNSWYGVAFSVRKPGSVNPAV